MTEKEIARINELARLKKEYGENAKGTRATLNARGAVIEINNIELYQGGNCMGVDSILGGNFSVQTKDFLFLLKSTTLKMSEHIFLFQPRNNLCISQHRSLCHFLLVYPLGTRFL